jgi:uncharacterized membrane protein
MSDALFQALFSHPPVVFNEGDFRFDITTSSLVAAAIVAVIGVLAIVTYRRVRVRDGRVRDRIVLTSLRLATFGLVLFCLLRPTLIVRAAVPQQNVVAVLFDDSRSMQIADMDGRPRAEFLLERFADPSSQLMRSLTDRFQVRTFRFSATAGRVASAAELTFSGDQTRLAAALDGVRDELAGLPMAGVVLLTDGADTSNTPMAETLLALKAQKLPVFTVGVGSSRLPRDIQIDRVSSPRTVLKDASVFIDVVVSNSGFGSRTVTVDVEDEGRIVGSEQVRLPADGSPATVRVRATASETGPRLFTFRVAPQEGEVLTQNNAREAMIQVRDVAEKILYFEGEPRWEMRFLKRAVADDANLEVVALQRTADNKYMRLFVTEPDDPDELATGFPTSREELFRYRGLILGSVEAAAFTGEQLQMIADFVDVRGGGLLVLGGPRALAEGGYGGTPVADVLPLAIDPRTRASEATAFLRLQVEPTQQGGSHAMTQIAETEEASVKRWPELPGVTTINAALPIKPGATLLLNGVDEAGRDYPVLSHQRFGRGKAIALSVQDTWTWQMHASIPVEDQTHERFWRQLLRFLVDGVPGTVEAGVATERVNPGEPVTIEATVVDDTYMQVNDATVVAEVARPSGGEPIDVSLQWTGGRDGRYRGTFVASEAGAYEVTVDADRAGERLGTSSMFVRASPGEAEYFDPTLHEAPLVRIAEETGGRYYRADNIAGIAEDMRHSGRGVTSVEERPLWNMPIVLIALLTLVCAEWGYRRAVGLA